VTSRQDVGVRMWDVDAAAVGDGMTRSVVRRSYLRLRARPAGRSQFSPRPAGAAYVAYVPVVTRRSLAEAATQFRPSRDGKCAVSALAHRHEAQFRSRRGRRQRSLGRVVSPATRR
jgi:hypothetical protein